MAEKTIHPVSALLLLVFGGPVLILLIGVGWAALVIGDLLLSILSWPFRFLGGLAAVVLGGGR